MTNSFKLIRTFRSLVMYRKRLHTNNLLLVSLTLAVSILFSACSSTTPNSPISNIQTIGNSKYYIQNNTSDFNLAKSLLSSQNYEKDGFETFASYNTGGLNAAETDQLMNCLSINVGNITATYATPFYLKQFKSTGGYSQTQTLIFAPSLIIFSNSQTAAQLFKSVQTTSGASCIIKQLYNVIDINLSNKLNLKSDSVTILSNYSPAEVNIEAVGTVIPKELPELGYFNFLVTQRGKSILMMLSESTTNTFNSLIQQYLNTILTAYNKTSLSS